ncbi:hypothetical protein ACH4TY_13500 [Streptomyces anulatus]
MPTDSVVGERELRFAGTRLAESLGDTLRIAASRDGRLENAVEPGRTAGEHRLRGPGG